MFKRFRARVIFRLGNRVAHAGSFLSILLLSATFNTQLEVQATGEDEEAAIRAAEAFFQSDDEQAARKFGLRRCQGKGRRDLREAAGVDHRRFSRLKSQTLTQSREAK